MATIRGGKTFEKKLAEIAARIDKPGTLRVGFLAGATYPDGTPVAAVAAIQNFGAPRAKIPPRPFFTNMVKAKKGEWPKAIAGLLKTNTVGDTLRIAGEAIAGQLREAIINTNSPPLSPVTLMLRRMRADNPALVVTGKTVGEAARRVAAGESFGGVSTKPLVEPGVGGGHMLNSVDYEVKT